MPFTGNDLIAKLRARINDEGDDTQLVDGTANPQFFWASDVELLPFLNAALYDIVRELVDLRRHSELKNLVSSTTLSDMSAVTDFYVPFAAEIDGRFAFLSDDPRDLVRARQTAQLAVTIVGNAVFRSQGTAHKIFYWKMPTPIAASDTVMTELTDPGYSIILDLAEFLAVHKDQAMTRLVLRREYGKTNIELDEVIEYLQNTN